MFRFSRVPYKTKTNNNYPNASVNTETKIYIQMLRSFSLNTVKVILQSTTTDYKAILKIPFDTNTTMKEILEDIANHNNKSLEKLKNVPEREATNNEASELPDRTSAKGGLNKKEGEIHKRTWDDGN